MLRRKDCPERLKSDKAFDTSIPERPLRRPDGKGPAAEIDYIKDWVENRRIRTDLAGWHHAFELRGIRQTTQPATGIMFRRERFYSGGAESMTRRTYRQSFKQLKLMQAAVQAASFRFRVLFQSTLR